MADGRYERELVRGFTAGGWGAMRCPSSGSATDRDLPDVLASRPRTTFAIELKSGSSTTLYVDASEVRTLERFAEAWGALPLLGCRPTTNATGREHWLIRPQNARKTPEGNYGLPVAEREDRASVVVHPDGEVRRL